ncbi:Glutamate--cysteine ligase [compost metagenome]
MPLLKGTLFLPYATALRMGNFGYQNSAQKQLGIHYNTMSGYLEGLQKAVKTPYAPFSHLGLTDDQGEPIQINDHVLQIENEYYSLVRPKQVPKVGETPSQALENRGVGYVELRAVDVNPYSSIGIDENTAAFLEVLALHCLLQDSPDLLDEEQLQIERNQAEVVNRGRAPNASIIDATGEHPIEAWSRMQVIAMQPLADLLDATYTTNLYSAALALMLKRIDEVDETLSAQVIADTLENGGTWGFGSLMAQQHAMSYEQHQLSPDTLSYFDDLAVQSLQQQQQLEQDSSLSFEQYLADYR